MRQLGKYGHRILLVVWLTINAIGITTQVGKESVFTWADYTSTLAALLFTAWLAWWASWEAGRAGSPQSVQVHITNAEFQEVLAHLTEISRITGRPASDFYDVNRENK